MIKKFVERWEEVKEKIREEIQENVDQDALRCWNSLVEIIMENMWGRDFEDTYEYRHPYPGYVHEIPSGDYEGNYCYLMHDGNGEFWYVIVGYGTCSGCDSFEAALEDGDTVNDMMTLALHFVQGIKKLEEIGI